MNINIEKSDSGKSGNHKGGINSFYNTDLHASSKAETKNERIGMITSICVHVVVLGLLMIPACNSIDKVPGYPVEGMQINIGFVDEGTGDVQASVNEVTNENPVEEVQEEEIEDAIVSENNLQNPDENPVEVKAAEKKTEKKEKTEPVKEKKQEVDPNNTYKGKTNSKSDGDKTKKGDQGKEHGDPNSPNYMDGHKGGNKLGDGGVLGSMDLPGWAWDSKPDKVDPTSVTGYVLFEFYVDEDGVVSSVRKLEGDNFSLTEESFYKKQLEKTTFHLKDSRAKPAPKTRGVFKFEVKTR